jgi:WhiB family redox-sensing transcriptional regulator
MTERERRALLRKRPNVMSWRRLLETAKADHIASSRLATSASVG